LIFQFLQPCGERTADVSRRKRTLRRLKTGRRGKSIGNARLFTINRASFREKAVNSSSNSLEQPGIPEKGSIESIVFYIAILHTSLFFSSYVVHLGLVVAWRCVAQ
jgi:hypothetical protein